MIIEKKVKKNCKSLKSSSTITSRIAKLASKSIGKQVKEGKTRMLAYNISYIIAKHNIAIESSDHLVNLKVCLP